MVWSNEGPHLLTVVWKFGGLVGVAVYMICGGVISIAALQQQDFGSVGHQVQNCSVAWEGVSDFTHSETWARACIHRQLVLLIKSIVGSMYVLCSTMRAGVLELPAVAVTAWDLAVASECFCETGRVMTRVMIQGIRCTPVCVAQNRMHC